MYGKKVKLRAIFILSIFFSLILVVFLIFKSLEENVVYFKSPTEIKDTEAPIPFAMLLRQNAQRYLNLGNNAMVIS